jgi:hypothetical protein
MSIRAARSFPAVLFAFSLILTPFAGLACAFPQGGSEEPAKPAQATEAKQAEKRQDVQPEEIKVLTVEEMLLDEIERLHREIRAMREELAKAQLEASQAVRERDELRQFLVDHQQLGEDFEKYQGVIEIKERELRRQRAEEHREKLRQQQEERQARMEAAKMERAAREASQNRLRRYEREGFYHVGSDVFVSAMAYLYKKENVPDTSYRFAPLIRFDGTFFFTRYWHIDYDEEIDFTEMTISGSVLNAAPEPRDVGVAITFFDQYGNQVGGQTVEVSNARKDAPYPFTAKLDMALDRPFSSYRIVVLYADQVGSERPDADADGGVGDGADDSERDDEYDAPD